MHCKAVWPETHACTHNGTPISKHKAEYYTVQEEAVVPTVVWPETHDGSTVSDDAAWLYVKQSGSSGPRCGLA